MVGGDIVAAVSVSGPLPRTTRQPGRLYSSAVIAAARAVEAALAEPPATRNPTLR